MAWNPNSLTKAAKKSGVDFDVDADWLTGPDPYGKGFQPVGIVWHHTACGALSRGNMPSLNWCRNPGQYTGQARACHIVVGRDGKFQIIAGRGAYHAGAGGPLKVNGKVIPKDLGNRHLLGIEIEAASTNKINKKNIQTPKWNMNPAQFDAVAKFCAALFDDLGWDTDAAIRHKDWAPGRKPDVGIELDVIREAIDGYRKSTVPPVKPKPVPVKKPAATKPVPVAKPSIRLSDVQPSKKNNSVKVLQDALKKEVGLNVSATAYGTYNAATKTAYKKWQTSLGYKGADADGIPGLTSLRKLGSKHGFTVKPQ